MTQFLRWSIANQWIAGVIYTVFVYIDMRGQNQGAGIDVIGNAITVIVSACSGYIDGFCNIKRLTEEVWAVDM